MSHFDVYGKIAQNDIDDTCKNGRYISQKSAEKLIADDVISKLKLNASDTVLDVGCGTGVNIGPMAAVAEHVTGCDHPNMVLVAQRNNHGSNIDFIGSDFLSSDIKNTFSKILIYGVVSTLPDEKTLFQFIDKALSLVKVNGRILIGDVPNQDKKKRFLSSERGKVFQQEWEAGNHDDMTAFEMATGGIEFTDASILGILSYIRNKGFHAYLMDQPQDLPFGNSREDILIIGSEYED